MRFTLRNLAVLVLVTMFASLLVFGQAEQGSITGVVTDPSGAVVPGATVTAKNAATGFTRTATSGGTGAYILPALPPAVYDVTVSKSGFADFKTQLKINVGGRQTLDASLAASGGSTTVEVSAEAGIEVNTQNHELSQVVTAQQIASLPSITRNPYDFVQTAGNVSQNNDASRQGFRDRGVNVTINGQRAASVDILLDGAENTDLFGVGVGQDTPIDSTQEFRVITSGIGAEYGRAGGGVVNVATKSGTNDFHGSAYEFNRVSALASKDFDQAVRVDANGDPLKKSPFTRNNFGFSIGGPVIKNKLFFFNNSEWLRIRSNLNQTAAILDPGFIAAHTPANVQAFYSALGVPKSNLVQTGVLTVADVCASATCQTNNPAFVALGATTPVMDVVNFSAPADAGGGNPSNQYNIVNRVDFNMTDKTTMFGKYQVQRQDFFAGTNNNSPYVGYDTGANQFNNTAMLSVTHTFSPTIVNTTKLLFARYNNLQPLDPATGTVPTLYFNPNSPVSFQGNTFFGPGYSATAPGNAIPFGGPQNFGEIANDLSWNKGNHTFKFGGQYLYIKDNRVFGAYQEGVAALSNSGIGTAFDHLINGKLSAYQVAVDPQGKFPCFVTPTAPTTTLVTPDCTLNFPLSAPRFDRANRFHDAALYASDSWKIHPRFTVNLGVRWEYYGVQHNNNPNFDSNFYYGSGATIFDQIANGQVLTTPNSPDKALWKPRYNNFAPRVGFAWDVFGTGKTSLRGGYGISYERNFNNVTFNVIQNPPNYAVLNFTEGVDGPAGSINITPDNLGPFAGTGTKPFPQPTLRNPDPKMKTAYAEQWDLSVDHEVLKNTTVSLAYSGSRGVHQYSLSNFNRVGAGNVYLGYPRVTSRLNLQYASANSRGANGDSYYHGMNVGFRTANLLNWGITATANYTWSHAIDDTSSTFTDYSANNNNTGFLDPFQPKLDLGDADYDARHRFTTSVVWDLPFAKNSGRLMKAIFGGYSFAPVYTYSSGNPFSVFDCSLVPFTVCPRAIFDTAASHSGTGSYTTDDPNNFNYLTLPGFSTTSTGSYGQYAGPGTGTGEFPTCSTPAVFGVSAATGCAWPTNMSRRNAFRGPSVWNLNLGAFKNIDVTERVKLRLSAEVENLFNHHNMFIVGNGVNDVSFTTLSGSRCSDTSCTNSVVDPNAGPLDASGTPTDPVPYINAFKAGRRHMSLGIRVTF
jgi:outer membrane receptor protein involved in Fe transport